MFDSPITIEQLKGSKISSKVQYTFRFFFLILHLATLVFITVHKPTPGSRFQMLKYMTIWGFLTCLLYFLFSTLSYSKYKTQEDINKDNGVFSYWKITTILLEIGITYELLIFLVYWSMLFHRDPFIAYELGLLKSVLIHGITPIAVILDLLIGKMRFYTSHWKAIMIYGLVYTVQNFIYVKITDQPVYPMLTWKDRGSIIFFFGSLICNMTMFFSINKFVKGRSEIKYKKI